MGSMHRIALISDLHGNAIALREVLRSIESRGVDEIVCLGDVATLGVAPGEVIDVLQQMGCLCITGNHDEYLLDTNLSNSHNDVMLLREAIDWAREELSRDQLDFVRGFVESVELPLGAEHRLKLFHGSPSSNMVDLLSDTPSDVFDSQLGPERSLVMAGGHTHIQMLRQHRGTLVVNPGSVGAPFREFPNGGPPKILDHAEYATIEACGADVSVVLHHVALDGTELARAASESPNPMSAELAAVYA